MRGTRVPGYSNMYGTEYEVASFPNMFSKSLHNHDAPCAVCHTELRGSQLMIPGRNICPSHWTLEYKGYLMSTSQNHNGRTSLFVSTGTLKAQLDVLVAMMVHYCILLKVNVVLFLVHHTPLVKK